MYEVFAVLFKSVYKYLYVMWRLMLFDKTLKDYRGVSLRAFVIQAD